MRNRSKRFHVPSQEWSKIVRFNSQDYLLRSVYDRNNDLASDGLSPDEMEVEFPQQPETKTVLDELPWVRCARRRKTSVRVNEDFMDDMEEFGFPSDEDADTEEKRDEIVHQMVSDELDKDLSYTFRTKSGQERQIRFSGDKYRNVIMFLLSNIISLADWCTADEIDDYVYASGRLNGLYAYRVNIIREGVECKGGIPHFIISDNDNKTGQGGGYINVHFTEERDAVISVSYPGIAYKRPFTLVTLQYADFCDLLPVDRITGRKKDFSEYHWMLMETMLENYMTVGAGFTLMKRVSNFQWRGNLNSYNCLINIGLMKQWFQTITKFSSKSQGDKNALRQAMDSDMEIVNFIWNNSQAGCGTIQEDDEYYVMIGASETLFERFRESVWGSQFGAALSERDCIWVQFFTQHPEISTKKVEHNAILLPLSNYVAVLPALVMWMMC